MLDNKLIVILENLLLDSLEPLAEIIFFRNLL